MIAGDRPEEGLRQRKARQTWETISREARRLALERSVEEISVQEIADRANVSVRTVFNYFPSKEDAVLGTRELRLPQCLADQFLAGTGPLVDDVAALVFNMMRENRGGFGEAVEVRELIERNPKLAGKLAKDLDQLEGRILPLVLARAADPLAAQVATLVGARLCGLAVETWARGGGTHEQLDSLREVVAALRRAV